MAVSAFHSERNRISEDMERQCNRHSNTPFRVVWRNRLFSLWQRLTLAGKSHFTESDRACQHNGSLRRGAGLDKPGGRGIMGIEKGVAEKRLRPNEVLFYGIETVTWQSGGLCFLR